MLLPDVPRVGVGPLEDGVLGKVVDHCKPANIAFLTLMLSNLVFIREGVIFAPCMPSILRRKIEKARCRKFKAKRNRNLN